MNALIQRLKSRTYQAALLGTVLTLIEANIGVVSNLIPAEYAKYVVLLWPAVMMFYRERTTTSISDK